MVTKKNENDEFYDDFFSPTNFLKKSKNHLLWHGSFEDSRLFIEVIPYSPTTDQAISYIYYVNDDFQFEDKEVLLFFERLKKCDYNLLAVSVVFTFLQVEYMKNRNMKNRKSLDYDHWAKVVSVLFQPTVSHSVLVFLNKMNIPDFLTKTKTEGVFKRGIFFALRFFSL